MIHGPKIVELREAAKAAVMVGFVRIAEASDGVPPTLRAMYVRKAEQAQLVLDGGSSRLIEGEAAIRGLSREEMARLVLSMAAAGGDELELKRVETNLTLEGARDEVEIIKILDHLGMTGILTELEGAKREVPVDPQPPVAGPAISG